VRAAAVGIEDFFEVALAAIDDLRRTQTQAIREAAGLLAERMLRGGVVQVFGTGHSRAFAMEMAGRAGGLVPVHAMAMEDLALRGLRPADDLRDLTLERRPEIAHELLTLYDIRQEDAFIVVSSSGRNGSTVELALTARQRGHPVVAVTSMEHTAAVTSRHPSGRRLFEVADLVIDNRAPLGDAVLSIGDGLRVCAVSSITGAFIAQGLTAEIVRHHQEAGVKPPVLISANVEGADTHNDALRQRYAGRTG
jgi:uncharacterized phosphosugar-binding protein